MVYRTIKGQIMAAPEGHGSSRTALTSVHNYKCSEVKSGGCDISPVWSCMLSVKGLSAFSF